MSTNGMTSWAVDLKDVGAIYPFQGSETLLVILGLPSGSAGTSGKSAMRMPGLKPRRNAARRNGRGRP